MECIKCGYDYPAKEIKCPYCGEPNSLGIAWKEEEEQKRAETEHTKRRILKSMPLYLANKLVNVILILGVLLSVVFVAIAFIASGVESAITERKQSQASVAEAEKLFEEDDNAALKTYLKQYEVFGKAGYEKYTERVLLYDEYVEFMRSAFEIQQILDWGRGEQPNIFWVDEFMDAGHDILQADSYQVQDLEYDENIQYLEEMQGQVSAVFMGALEMTEDEIKSFVGLSEYSEEYDEMVKMVMERKGWEYAE